MQVTPSREPISEQEVVDALDKILVTLEQFLNYAVEKWGISTAFEFETTSDGKTHLKNVEFIKRLRPSSERDT